MRVLLYLLFLMMACNLQAQNNRTIANQEFLWLVYNGNFKLNSKFTLLTEYQWRRIDFGENWQQSLPRIGIEYKTKAGVNFAVGYALPVTYPYGEQPVAYVFNEHRAWEQMSFGHTNGKFKFAHRYRFEQRWLEVKTKNSNGEFESDSTRYLNRVRYRFMVNYNLKHFESSNSDLFFTAMDEVFVSFGKHVTKNIFDQNRISGAVGFTFKGKYTTTLGYLNQFIIKADAIKCESNHVLQVGFTLSL
ncbi:MAG TPA: DUF2490 domain-containing protein [Flavobacteriales bacterium]|nr:DUF2490 domain-containing protein [Flavobacteriales bacterium]